MAFEVSYLFALLQILLFVVGLDTGHFFWRIVIAINIVMCIKNLGPNSL